MVPRSSVAVLELACAAKDTLAATRGSKDSKSDMCFDRSYCAKIVVGKEVSFVNVASRMEVASVNCKGVSVDTFCNTLAKLFTIPASVDDAWLSVSVTAETDVRKLLKFVDILDMFPPTKNVQVLVPALLFVMRSNRTEVPNGTVRVMFRLAEIVKIFELEVNRGPIDQLRLDGDGDNKVALHSRELENVSIEIGPDGP